MSLYLTEERLVIYEAPRNCTVARLDHLSSVRSMPTINAGQQSAAWVLFIAGAQLQLCWACSSY